MENPLSDQNVIPSKLPNTLIWGIVAICALPFLLNVAGMDFGSHSTVFPWKTANEVAHNERADTLFVSLSGSFSHTILEWSAFMTALFTVFLAFLHFGIKKDITTLVLGIAIFCSGIMDAFHTLAADRLIEAVADNQHLIPFTWAISRMFNALILIVGVSLFFFKKNREFKGDLRFVLLTSMVFGCTAYGIIDYCAISAELPQTMYPDSLITRPFDVIPLLLFAGAGLTLFLRFYRQQPGIFTHALLVSMIPEVVVQLHMAFGSTALFDNHFNIAHFIKILAYLVPFLGLALDYLYTYRLEAQTVQELQHESARRTLAEAKAQRLAAIVESSDDAIIALDLDGIIQSWNSGAERMFGFTTEEMLGKTTYPFIPMERYDEETEFIKHLRQEEFIHHFETTRIQKNGHLIHVAVSISPIRDKEGTLIGISKIAHDITKRKHAEALLEIQHTELTRSNQELDDFAYIASHDLKEPLRGIHNYSRFLLEDHGMHLGEDAQAKCETLMRLSQRMEELIDTLFYFSRLGRTELAMREVNLQHILQEVLDSLDIRLKEYGVAVCTPRLLPTVYCDQARVGEVFRNLLTNAMKYNDKPEKRIEIGYIEKHGRGVQAPRNHSVFYVQDNGIGIREKHIESIFRIFKRLHGRDKFGGGTGAGLTLTKKIIERHGGRLWVESIYGEGTTFSFTLSKEGQ